jgi:hypothetical protein
MAILLFLYKIFMPKSLVISSGSGVLTDNVSIETSGGVQKVKDDGVTTLKTKFEVKSVYNSMVFRDPGLTAFTPYSATYYDLQYSSELDAFYAVGKATGLSDRSFSISYDNGVTWSHVQMPTYQSGFFSFATHEWRSITRSPQTGVMVAVANQTFPGYYGSYTAVAYSLNNGTTWTTASGLDSLGQWRSVCWSPELGLFCAVRFAVGGAVTACFATSSNGSSWSGKLAQARSWESICWSPELGLFCAVGSGYVATSSNGNSWTVTAVSGISGVGKIVWSPQLGLFCVKAGSLSFASSNGIDWTSKVTISGSSQIWSSDLMAFVGIGGSGGVIVSSNGLDWNLACPNSGDTRMTQSSKTGAFLSINGNSIRKFL